MQQRKVRRLPFKNLINMALTTETNKDLITKDLTTHLDDLTKVRVGLRTKQIRPHLC